MTIKKYTASFVATALLYPEFLRLKELLLSTDFELLIDQETENNKYLRIKTLAARKRIVQEIRKRVASAGRDFWTYFFSRGEEEQKLALLFLCLKTYPLMMDFHLEVALKRWKARSEQLTNFDLQMRLDEISSAHPEVDAWSESTKTKTITVYLRTLTEAGLLKNGKLQKPTRISPEFWDYFLKTGEAWFLESCFTPIGQI